MDCFWASKSMTRTNLAIKVTGIGRANQVQRTQWTGTIIQNHVIDPLFFNHSIGALSFWDKYVSIRWGISNGYQPRPKNMLDPSPTIPRRLTLEMMPKRMRTSARHLKPLISNLDLNLKIVVIYIYIYIYIYATHMWPKQSPSSHHLEPWCAAWRVRLPPSKGLGMKSAGCSNKCAEVGP